MSEVTNSDLLTVLLEMKGDIGGLKSSTGLMLEGLKSHAGKIAVLESGAATLAGETKAKVRMWGMVATVVSAIVGAVIGNYRPH